MQSKISIGDIFREHGDRYIYNHHVSGQEKGIIHLLSACRTSVLGSHYKICTACNYMDKSYNSCRNRHCPSCQQKDKLQWLDKRMQELLPVGYYHLVFTIPHELNQLCLQNKKVMYGILFRAASQSILELAKDPKHLGADTGLVSVLHTWGQNLMEHPHLHCIMPAGGLSSGKECWVHPEKKDDFFVYYKVLSRLFRGKYLALLQQAFDQGKLLFKGKLANLAGKRGFETFKSKLYAMEWVVNIQAPFGKPEKVLEYLSRYVFRIAIGNRRIVAVKNGKVHFTWKDNRSGLFRKMALEIDEFIRRYLLHVLPNGFFKVRYTGIFANRSRKKNIATAKKVLSEESENRQEEAIQDGCQIWTKQDTVWDEILKLLKEIKRPNCPKCKKGHMVFAGIVPEQQALPG